MKDNTVSIDLDRCLSKIAQRDRYALEELYRAFAKPIYRYALMILQDTGLAEDAMHNTFLKIMAGAGTYRLGTNPRAWIFRITRNVCTDIHNSKLPLAEDPAVLTLADEHSIDDLAESIAVRDAVARLTVTEREILSLYLVGGLKQTEIAKIMKLPYVRVRSHYEVAIKKLRKELSDK